MDENKDDYLKKKLHIKDRFIKRLETEKRQLEIDNNSLKHRLKLVESQLNGLTSNRSKNTCNGQEDNREQVPTQGSQRNSAEPQTMASNLLPRYIPFPNTHASSVEMAPDLHGRIPMPTANVAGQDFKNDQLLNENLEYTLEISYLKARLRSSDAARTVAERKIESLEEELRQLENTFDREMSDSVESATGVLATARQRSHSSDSHTTRNQVSQPGSVPNNHHSCGVGLPTKPSRKDSPVQPYSTLMNSLSRILQIVLSLDEKMNRIQQDRHMNSSQGKSS